MNFKISLLTSQRKHTKLTWSQRYPSKTKMEKVHILDVNMDTLLTKEPIQAYLDASIYNTIPSSNKNVAVSKKKVEYNQHFQFKSSY